MSNREIISNNAALKGRSGEWVPLSLPTGDGPVVNEFVFKGHCKKGDIDWRVVAERTYPKFDPDVGGIEDLRYHLITNLELKHTFGKTVEPYDSVEYDAKWTFERTNESEGVPVTVAKWA